MIKLDYCFLGIRASEGKVFDYYGVYYEFGGYMKISLGER